MADRVLPGPLDATACLNEAVCIHTRKIYSSCKDKDCIEDLRVYPTAQSQAYIETAFSVRPRGAELLFASVNVDEVSFNRGYYAVDVTYFYRVRGDTFPGCQEVTGLAIFNKRVMLFGSEGSAKVFSSCGCGCTESSADQPVAVVEAVDPIALGMKLLDCDNVLSPTCEEREIPTQILTEFPEGLFTGEGKRTLYVTLGQFSIIRLERDSQLVIPVYDYCLPDKECPGSDQDDPCTLFSRISFPVDEFFPPDSIPQREDYRTAKAELNC